VSDVLPRQAVVKRVSTRNTWSLLLADYAKAQRAAGRSEGTIRLHRYRISDLCGIAYSPGRVTTDQLVTILATPGWAPETRKSVRGAYRSFFRWAYQSGRLDQDPSEALPSVRVPQAVARPAPETVVRAGMVADERTRLMVMLAAYAGLRACEIAAVHSEHLDVDVLRITGKGQKIREVPIVHEGLLERLQAVVGWAFPNGLGSHLSPGHVTRLISRALPEGWTAHTLRHRMATAAYAGSRDILAVGCLLGHARPETTQRYVRMPDDAVRAAARWAAA
jgi:integrase/recombinase XerC